jgi:hypothetical protein
MGFPDDYQWGPQELHFRKYLSKGVVPAVAEWILRNLTGSREKVKPYLLTDGGMLDFRPKRAEAIQAARQGKLI